VKDKTTDSAAVSVRIEAIVVEKLASRSSHTIANKNATASKGATRASPGLAESRFRTALSGANNAGGAINTVGS
jgi:hypothetical protein